MTTAFFAISVLCAIVPTISGGNTELKAAEWFNSPSIQIPDQRTYVLFFFTSTRDRDVAPYIPRLNKLNKRNDIVVVGLTVEPKERIVQFIKKRKVKFTIGTRSKAYKDFKIKRFPQIVVLGKQVDDGKKEWVSADLDSIDQVVPPPPVEVAQLAEGAFDDNSSIETLKTYASTSNYDGYLDRKRALMLLREKLPSGEFLPYCDKLLNNFTPCDLDYGIISYERQLADPTILEKEPKFSPVTEFEHELRNNPEDSRGEPIARYVETEASRSVDQLYNDYFDRLTDDGVDGSIRQYIADRLASRAEKGIGDKQKIRASLMDMLTNEQDATVRQHLVGALSDACDPGDFEAADFLEKQLETEKNVRTVRPMMAYVIRYLRTGEE